MTSGLKYPVAVGAVFIWIGFVGAISFMEAWLKFQAPGITIPLALGIGKLVFSALNKVELLLAVIVMLNLFLSGGKWIQWKYLSFLLVLSILILQTTWLLPTLDERAMLIIQGQEVPPSNLHFFYIGVELIKVISLGIFGIKLLKT